MTYLNRIKTAQKALANTKKPISLFDLRYTNVKTAKEAWDLFFTHFIISLKGIKRKRTVADIIELQSQKQKALLSEIFQFLDDIVTQMSQFAMDFVVLMKKYQDTDAYQQSLTEHYADLVDAVNLAKQEAQSYIHRAEQEKITHLSLYSKYEKYLKECSTLKANTILDGFLKNKLPLENFDDDFLVQ